MGSQELEGMVALVTGGASGIGRAAAVLLGARGASVVVADLTGDGERVDVTDEGSVRAVVDRTMERHGRLDAVVTAAGIQHYGTVESTDTGDWDRVLAVNVRGAFLTIKHALPLLRASGHGAVVAVSSVQAFATQSDVAAYTASKGALNALIRSIAIDEARHGVRANAVCPGSVDTPMLRASARRFGGEHLIAEWGRSHPLGRVARPEEVAEAIAFLAGPRAGFISGVSLPVDGGLLAALPVALP